MTKKQSKTTATAPKLLYTIENSIPPPDPNHIIKLNQELTEENSRLLERMDELNDMVAKAIEIKEGLLDKIEDLKKEYSVSFSFTNNYFDELDTIKSKWWYKLFRNW